MQIDKEFPLWIWLVYLGLFALSIPWYLADSLAMQLIFGIPFWVMTSILAILLAALFTIWAVHKFWKDNKK